MYFQIRSNAKHDNEATSQLSEKSFLNVLLDDSLQLTDDIQLLLDEFSSPFYLCYALSLFAGLGILCNWDVPFSGTGFQLQCYSEKYQRFVWKTLTIDSDFMQHQFSLLMVYLSMSLIVNSPRDSCEGLLEPPVASISFFRPPRQKVIEKAHKCYTPAPSTLPKEIFLVHIYSEIQVNLQRVW